MRTTIAPTSNGFTWFLNAGKPPPSADDLPSHSVRYNASKAPWGNLATITTPSTKTRSQGIWGLISVATQRTQFLEPVYNQQKGDSPRVGLFLSDTGIRHQHEHLAVRVQIHVSAPKSAGA